MKIKEIINISKYGITIFVKCKKCRNKFWRNLFNKNELCFECRYKNSPLFKSTTL